MLRSMLLAGLVTLAVGAVSQESLTCRSDSASSVVIYGKADRSGYLGLSVYPLNSQLKPYHTVVPVKAGTWQERLSLGTGLGGGRFEVALWEHQILRGQCSTRGCKWCSSNGFHMEGMRAYSSGQVGR